ncbi:IclR helix-turn-helix domain-containing protein [Arthrobacter alpinus]|uniref:IclR helix-turn-helix domain-containing protein n=1 Tax=Arthrobacter alpinus TaxID=656366 RepID=A0A1H5HM83_9MICC|nr:Helicase associated domain protein [Arthrobacter alpinus]SEE29122.1 IclR helix-turn-helix domain-containing protein [Arthrobacter alpinus]
MLRWDISLHPSWDRMYKSGMTVREISDLTGRPLSTVHRHLQVRQIYDDEIRSIHDAANAARDPGWPTTHWQRRYKATQIFLAANARLPAVGSDEEESSLARWVAHQRALHIRGELPDIQITLMDMLPGWTYREPSVNRDEHWRHRLADLQAFVTETGSLPRYKRYDSEHEYSLGVWLHTQHQRRAEGSLKQWRMEALNEALAGWHSSM